MASITLNQINKSYGDTRVVENVSLNITSGEFVVLLGPSGCGKSTILRMIAGLETLNSGEIHIGDRRVDNLPAGERDVAMVFQNYALYPHMTVKDNLAFGLRNAGVEKSEVDRRCLAAATRLEIQDLLTRKPAALSGGQRQRVAIARAIAKKPSAFLFDEPLSNLDAALRGRTRIELAQLHQRLGATMVFVTHDQVEAMTLADRIVVLANKGIEQVGTPMEIYERPATRFVAEFVGSPTMNMLDCRLDATGKNAVASIGTDLQVETKINGENITGQNLTLGIRPEHVRVSVDGVKSKATNAVNTVIAKVVMIERLGERSLIHVVLPSGTTMICEDTGMSRLQSGDTVRLHLNGAAAHLFDADGRGYHADMVTAGQKAGQKMGQKMGKKNG